jgi:para-nitrobenzyl esterase
MKHLHLLIAFISLSFGDQVSADDCGERYQTYIADQINTFKDIEYGSNLDNKGIRINLLIDIFTPSGDVANNRPLIIFAHGGAFVYGNKTTGVQDEIARDFARKGYVTACINYRLHRTILPDLSPILEFADKAEYYEAITRVSQDIKAAIRFMKRQVAENGNPYGIDTNNIILYGCSSGAIGSLHAVYMTDLNDADPVFKAAVERLGGLEGNSGNSGYGSVNSVRAVVSSSGALTERTWIGNRKDVDLIAFHHNIDPVVPFGYGCFATAACHLGRFYGSNPLTQEAKKVGVINELHFINSVGHPADEEEPELVISEMTRFLYENQCKYLNQQITPVIQKSISALSLFPNPANHFTRINWNFDGTASISVTDLSGRLLYSSMAANNFADIPVSNLPSGMYVVQVISKEGTGTARLVVE